MKKLAFFIVFILGFKTTYSQFKANTYINESVDGYIHLYFDQQYFLTNQNCEFKFYTRVCKYNKATNGFNGFFTDYYNNNQIALTGNYKEGKKDGNFKGFYLSGKPKFDTYFEDDKASGLWTYYYPSGALWLKVQFINNNILVKDFWNVYGVQKVVNGNGKYSFTEDVLDYNELGYNAINFKGRVRNGKPVGIWSSYLIFSNKIAELMGFEYYTSGKFTYSDYFYPKFLSPRQSLLQLYPSCYENNAKSLISKPCTIDDSEGYNIYLQEYLNANLPSIWSSKEGIPDANFKVAIVIDSTGKSSKISLLDSIPKKFGNQLIRALQNIIYWIPSYTGGKTVEDTATITFSSVLTSNQRRQFGYPLIVRTKED